MLLGREASVVARGRCDGDASRCECLRWIARAAQLRLEDRVVSHVGSSLPHSVRLGEQSVVRVGWRNHPRHLSITVKSIVLGDVVPFKVWLELDGELDRAQVSLCLNNSLSTIVVVVAPRDLRVERLDWDSSNVTQGGLP